MSCEGNEVLGPCFPFWPCYWGFGKHTCTPMQTGQSNGSQSASFAAKSTESPCPCSSRTSTHPDTRKQAGQDNEEHAVSLSSNVVISPQ
jgi:hypothetical protein